VEPPDWREAVDAVGAASVRLHERARRPRSAGTIRVSMSAAMFQMTTAAAADD
jgi:hypothetical protein